MIKLIFPQSELSELAQRFRRYPLESFALMLARPVPTPGGNWRLLIESIHEPSPAEYEKRTDQFVKPIPAFRLPLEKRARSERLSLVYCHSHPHELGIPAFSVTDDQTEQALAGYAAQRVQGVPHLSLLIGRESVCARQLGSGPPIRVFEIGRRIVQLFPANDAETLPQFDRQVRAFGVDGQRAIENLVVAIVGTGGTGSVMAQQLAYLGVRHFLLIDPDTIDETSLNRVVGASLSDIGKPKVEIAKRTIRFIAKDAIVEPLQRDVLKRDVAARLKDADLVFCCTDSHGSRHILNQLAYQYFMPTIDMGVVIGVSDGRVTHIDGRVKMLAPGMGCLVCHGGILSPDHVRSDLSNAHQRQADPYFLAATNVAQPSVISLNSTMGSLATTMFLAAVAGVPAHARSQIYRGVPGVVRTLDDTPKEECVVCSTQFFYGKGDLYDLPARCE